MGEGEKVVTEGKTGAEGEGVYRVYTWGLREKEREQKGEKEEEPTDLSGTHLFVWDGIQVKVTYACRWAEMDKWLWTHRRATYMGFDTEWTPEVRKGQLHPMAVVQLADSRAQTKAGVDGR